MRNALLRITVAVLLCFVVTLLSKAETPQKLIIIDVQRMTLTLYENQREVRKFPVAAGAWKTPSPLGVFRIVSRFAPKDAGGFGTRFLGLNVPWGSFGIHGTNKPTSIGSHASHGCFRMFSRDAEALYAAVPNGTKVIVEGGPYGELGATRPYIQPGDRNAAVRALQRRLRALGYFDGSLDGVYGTATTQALRAFQKERGMSPTHGVDQHVYDALGLILFE